MPPQPALPPYRLTRLDYLGMAAGLVFCLLITVINSRHRLLWEDELLGWTLLRDPSWRHMIHAWNLGADGGGFTFYLLGRLWFALAGANPLTFRLLSGLCFGLAFAVTWAALRRLYPFGITALALTNSWFFSPPLTQHMIEGRFYGQLILATSLAAFLALVLDRAERLTPRLYFAAFAAHALLTTTHVLGAIFSAVLLAATVTLDLLAQRRRPALYLTVAASWLLLLPERASLRAAAAVGKPHFWTKPPGWRDLLGPYTGYSNEILLILLALVVLALLRRRPNCLHEALRTRRPAYAITLALFAVPVLFVFAGLRGTWLFNDRYLLPVTVAVAYLTAELLTLAVPPRASGTWAFNAPQSLDTRNAVVVPTLALYLAFLIFWDFHHVARFTPTHPDYTAQLARHLSPGLPVVCEDAFTFTELLQNPATARNAIFLLDWPWALNPQAPRVEVTQFHLMENWRKAGYYAPHIQDASQFLAQTPSFLVLHAGPPGDELTPPDIGNPLAKRLTRDPAFTVRKVYTLDRLKDDAARDTVWLVCRDGCPH